jgi:Zn finger protein HypA/HybF involved in hydrogenase expression
MKAFKLVFKSVTRTCMDCKKQYECTDGCVLCPDCSDKRTQRNKLLDVILGRCDI